MSKKAYSKRKMPKAETKTIELFSRVVDERSQLKLEKAHLEELILDLASELTQVKIDLAIAKAEIEGHSEWKAKETE